jgi:hypothetical protein
MIQSRSGSTFADLSQKKLRTIIIDRICNQLDHGLMKKQSLIFSLSSTALLSACLLFSGCKVENNAAADSYVDGTAEVARQLSDVMASVDEMGGSSGTISIMASCYGSGFGACSGGNTVTRNFSNCTTSSYTFNGSVSLIWGGNSNNCTMLGTGGSITRTPNYTSTGGRNGQLSVFQNGASGEVLTWVSGSSPKVFSYYNGGIRRTVGSGGTIYYDVTMSTQGDVTVTGQDRSGRVMNGGMIQVLNNISGAICTISPQNVTWADANCTCASQGSWQGTCSNGSLFRMDLLGCGNAQLTVGNYSESVQLDRCTNM